MIRSPGDSWDGHPRLRWTPGLGDGYPSAIARYCHTVDSTMSARRWSLTGAAQDLAPGG